MTADRWHLAVIAAGLLVGAAVSTLAGQERGPSQGELLTRIDSVVRMEMRRALVAGASVVVEHRGELLVVKGYGLADLEHSIPATAETVFRIGSLTKQVTSVAVLQLVERGKIGLDDPITKFLPTYPSQGHRVTVHHLLSHTSGVASYTSAPAFPTARLQDLTHAEVLALFAGQPFLFTPGERWEYSNSGYYLLGMIVEAASGETYADYVRGHIFAPLGMANSAYCDPRAIVPHRARGYGRQSGRAVNADAISLKPPGGAGALCSTALDVLRWQRALGTGRLLSDESRRLMTTPGTLNDGSKTAYGYGLEIRTVAGHRQIGHSGGIDGFMVRLDTYPDDDLVVGVFTNTTASNADRIARLIGQLVLSIPLPELADLPLPSDWQARYPGTYVVSEELGLRFRVWSDGDALMSESPSGWSRLLYQGDDRFAVEANADHVVQFPAGPGPAAELVVLVGDQRLRAPRAPPGATRR